MGCFSLQTYKVNAGEGGILITDDEDVAARAILMTGCYMLFDQHDPRPSDAVFALDGDHAEPLCASRNPRLRWSCISYQSSIVGMSDGEPSTTGSPIISTHPR